MKSYGIEVQHVTTDDHGEWQVRTTNEDGDISTTGTFYVTVAKEPKDIKILCLNKVTSNMEECDDQVTHFNALFSIFGCESSPISRNVRSLVSQLVSQCAIAE